MATRKATKAAVIVPAFTVKRTNVADKKSGVTKALAMHFDEETRSIKVLCQDGKLRECKVDRLTDINAGRQMFMDLKTYIEKGQMVKFVAAGGFDPNKWFYTVEVYKEPKNGLPF